MTDRVLGWVNDNGGFEGLCTFFDVDHSIEHHKFNTHVTSSATSGKL